MKKAKLEQIIQQGIFGTPEIRPEEKHLFLGTFAERVRLALTNAQVYKTGMYDEALRLMKTKKDVRMLVNGSLPYSSYSNYVKAASETGIPFTIHNDFHSTPIGIVFAAERAVHNEKNMFIKDEFFYYDMEGEQ
ncbi:MAG: DUF1694 domain-containing protein [Alkalicoccus sp.]|nr:MAG: DUF1694 domain-containing protein [Alkalicoccus sp.]